MKNPILGKTLNDLRQKLDSVRRHAHAASIAFEELRTQAESLKIRALKHHLDRQRVLLAGSRGFITIMRNRKALRTSLVIAAAASAVTGVLSKDKLAAANAGLSTLDGMLQEAGRTDCAVCLGKRLTVTPKDEITSGGIWVAWDSVKEALAKLETEASMGAPLGNLDSIVSRLRDSANIIVLNKTTLKLIDSVVVVKPADTPE
jgi:hypothetical protein